MEIVNTAEVKKFFDMCRKRSEGELTYYRNHPEARAQLSIKRKEAWARQKEKEHPLLLCRSCNHNWTQQKSYRKPLQCPQCKTKKWQ